MADNPLPDALRRLATAIEAARSQRPEDWRFELGAVEAPGFDVAPEAPLQQLVRAQLGLAIGVVEQLVEVVPGFRGGRGRTSGATASACG